MRQQELQGGDRRWEHLQLARSPQLERLDRSDPPTRDRLDVVVQGLLIRWCGSDEEPGVESAALTDRSHPVVDEVDPLREQHQPLVRTHVDERPLTVVHRVTRHLEPLSHRSVVEPDDVLVTHTASEQDTRLLETLANRGDQPCQTPRREPHPGRCSGVVDPVTDGLEQLTVIGVVDRSPGEHVLTPGERRRQRSLQHEHLRTVVRIPDEHHRGRRPDRNIGGQEWGGTGIVRHVEGPYRRWTARCSVGAVAAPNRPDEVLDHIGPGTELIVPLANGEPTAVLDAVEAAAERRDDRIDRVRVHQMHALHERRYLAGDFDERLSHVSYFLSHVTRPHFARGTIELVPAHFSEVFVILRSRTTDPLVVALASPPDRHGYFSLGVSADYTSSFIGRARFFLEITDHMPRTFGRNQLHISQVEGWCRSDRPLVEVPPREPDEIDRTIAGYVADRIPNGATIQTGIGAIPNAIMAALSGHRDLGIHTELLSDGVVDLMEAGVVNGVRKDLNRTKTVGTFALGTERLHRFLHENTAVELWPVRYVNDPSIIGRERGFVSINATLSVDFLGQCASETIDGNYYSSSGGQNDFARGAMNSEGGRGFVVLRSTTSDGTTRIVPRLAAGDAVTTPKNTVDQVVTEYGVAELRGRSIRERTRALISVAHPDHRAQLTEHAEQMHYL